MKLPLKKEKLWVQVDWDRRKQTHREGSFSKGNLTLRHLALPQALSPPPGISFLTLVYICVPLLRLRRNYHSHCFLGFWKHSAPSRRYLTWGEKMVCLSHCITPKIHQNHGFSKMAWVMSSNIPFFSYPIPSTYPSSHHYYWRCRHCHKEVSPKKIDQCYP